MKTNKPFRILFGYFLKKEGEKEVLRLNRLFFFFLSLLSFYLIYSMFFSKSEEKVVAGYSERPFFSEEKSLPIEVGQQLPIESAPEIVEEKNKVESRPNKVAAKPRPLKKKKILPTGTNLLGKLLTSIDTRELSGLVKVQILYDIKLDGEIFLDKSTVLLGKANYPGSGEKVYIELDKMILSNGEEKEIQGKVTDSKDYNNGLSGKYHSGTILKTVSSFGLNMVSGTADAYAAKAGPVLQGISRAGTSEAERRASEASDAPVYVTIEAGQGLIITLEKAYLGK